METEPQITFHHLDPSPAIESRVREEIAGLEQYFDGIVGCRVVIEAPHKHHRKGRLYAVRVDLTVPGKEIFVTRESQQNHAHEDVYVVIRDAFGAARRQLRDYVRQLQGKVKRHAPPAAAAPEETA